MVLLFDIGDMDSEMMNFLTIGVILGLSAGFAPGPLLALVISETLQHGIRSGVKVAFAPIVTDLPIILLTIFILARLSGFHDILGVISISGGCFILYMGVESIRAKGVSLAVGEQPRSLSRGILANALSPHPYLFWFSVGAPTVIKAMNLDFTAAAAFIIGFYTFLVGSKILLAVLVGRSRSFLSGTPYRYVMRFLGLVLIALAFVLFHDGLKLLGLIS
jgi:threonine/homoserine/homoserine lactone efflux protein